MNQKRFKQSDLSFVVGPKFQTVWGLREAFVFALEGVGVSTFFLFAYTGQLVGMVCSIAAVMAAVVLLLSHLGRPRLAWRAIMNIRRSWISRGTVMISAFIALATIYVVGNYVTGFEFLRGISPFVLFALLIAGVFILLYPGFAMRASAGIAFWVNSIQLVLSCLNGLTSGMIVIWAVLKFLHPQHSMSVVPSLSIAALLTTGFFVAILAVQSIGRGGAARLSMRTLLEKEVVLFWLFAVGLGLLLPLLTVLLGLSGSAAIIGIVVGRVIGDVAFRYAILKVGAFKSIV